MFRLSFFILLSLSFSTSAQKFQLRSGNLKVLKGQKSYDIKFEYDNLIIGANKPEKDFLEGKRALWEGKEPGKGAEFVKMWFDDRAKRYEPAFVKNFEKWGGVKLYDKSAQYTLIVKTKYTEGGWAATVAGYPAEVGGELWIVETADNNKVIGIADFKYQAKEAYGADFEMTRRIQDAYVEAGTGLGYFLKKKSK